VRIFGMAEIRRRGLAAVFAEALAIAGAGRADFGLSIDVDVLNPDEAPGVETPARGGLTSAELLPLLDGLGRLPTCRAIELAEYDPGHDRDGRTAVIVLALVRSLFGKTAEV